MDVPSKCLSFILYITSFHILLMKNRGGNDSIFEEFPVNYFRIILIHSCDQVFFVFSLLSNYSSRYHVMVFFSCLSVNVRNQYFHGSVYITPI